MKKISFICATLSLTAGTVLAAPRETRNAPASIGVFAPADSALNTPFTLSYTGNAGGAYTVKAVRIAGTITANDFNTWCSDITLQITPPGGPMFAVPFLDIDNDFTTHGFTNIIPVPIGTAAAGTWSFKLVDAFDDDAAPELVESTIDGMTIALDDGVYTAPASTNLGTLAAGTVTQDFTLGLNEIKWFRFAVGTTIDSFNSNTLDITTNASLIGDTTLGVYTSTGELKTFDDDGGDLFLSYISYGGGSGGASVGQDGSLPIGTYYLAVAEYRSHFGPAYWNVATVASDEAFDRDVHLALTITQLPPSTNIPTVSHDFGTLGNARVTHAFADVPAGEMRWIKFTTPSEAIDATGFYVDIDTENSITDDGGFGGNDTELGVYRSNGIRIANNDDSDFGNDVFLSCLSFGDTAPTRAYTTVIPGNGRNGRLPAGTYYAVAGSYNLNFAGSDFNVTYLNGGVAMTSLTFNIKSNFAPLQCSVADVGVVGGGNGHDNRLDNNDFVAFINLFFAQSPSADVGVVGGGPGSDGQWDNNDFVAFINFFFNDQANCTG